MLVDVETRYLPLEKMALALGHAMRKLPHYFQAHTVWMLTKYPLQSLLRRSNFTSRIAKWGTRHETFVLQYKPRNSIKGQVLVDFVAEFTPASRISAGVCQVSIRPWRVFVDGVSNVRGSGVVVIMSPKGLRLEKSLRLCFRASNNEVEYEALIASFRAT